METIWTPIINYVKNNPDVAIAYTVLFIFIVWLLNQFGYSTILKNINAQAKDWRIHRTMARIVWSEQYFKEFKWTIIAMLGGLMGHFISKYVYGIIPFEIVGWIATIALIVFLVSIPVFVFLFFKEDKHIRLFMNNQLLGKQYKFLCYMKGSGLKWVSIDSRKIRGYNWKSITFESKCIYYDGELNSYFLSMLMPETYKTKVREMEKELREVLKDIDSRVTLGSRASPQNVQQNFMQHSIPLDPDDYRESIIEPDEGPGPVVRSEEVSLKKEQKEEYEKKPEKEERPRGRILRGNPSRRPRNG